MATYRTIASTETDPEAPVTAQLMKALEANPTAIAEGATGAPRVLGKALGGVSLGAANTSVATAFTNCDGMSLVIGNVAIAGAVSGVSIRARFSSNNGATWGTYRSFGAHTATTDQYIVGSIRFNLVTGDWQSATISHTGGSSIGGGTFSVPTGCNAFEISLSDATPGVIDLFCLGGL